MTFLMSRQGLSDMWKVRRLRRALDAFGVATTNDPALIVKASADLWRAFAKSFRADQGDATARLDRARHALQRLPADGIDGIARRLIESGLELGSDIANQKAHELLAGWVQLVAISRRDPGNEGAYDLRFAYETTFHSMFLLRKPSRSRSAAVATVKGEAPSA